MLHPYLVRVCVHDVIDSGQYASHQPHAVPQQRHSRALIFSTIWTELLGLPWRASLSGTDTADVTNRVATEASIRRV